MRGRLVFTGRAVLTKKTSTGFFTFFCEQELADAKQRRAAARTENSAGQQAKREQFNKLTGVVFEHADAANPFPTTTYKASVQKRVWDRQ